MMSAVVTPVVNFEWGKTFAATTAVLSPHPPARVDCIPAIGRPFSTSSHLACIGGNKLTFSEIGLKRRLLPLIDNGSKREEHKHTKVPELCTYHLSCADIS